MAMALGPRLARAAVLCAKRSLFAPNFNGSRCLSVGDVASVERIFTPADVEAFAALSGDSNPIHLDSTYAKSKNLPACVVHGALINGLVSAVIGTKLPGPGCVVVHQVLEFPKPLLVGEPVSARVEVTFIRKSIVHCTYECKAGPQKVVMTGEVKLFIRPEGVAIT
ncbi:hydroxyacyl-thioester dehydratase type 2, mitochondrial-like isoform X1 [Amblyomma americanum]